MKYLFVVAAWKICSSTFISEESRVQIVYMICKIEGKSVVERHLMLRD